MASAAALVFAGKSVAAPAISFLVNKAFSYLNGYFGAESMEEMRTKLARGMPKIQAVLDVVDPDQIKDKSEALDAWFWQLRDAVEEAEDAIDDFEYLDLEEKANDRKISDWGSPFAKMKHKVVRSVKHVGILDKTVKQFTHRDTLKKLMKAMENLDKVVVDIPGILGVTDYLNVAASRSQLQVHRETGSTLSATTFVGREKEKEQIIGWLAKTSVQSAEIVTSTNAIPIFSVVGHGGMGKTTLAQSICEEDEVLKHYKVIWVTVSTSFDATSVTSKILECATGKKLSANHLEPLQQALKEKLKSNNFLLVLDDVWEDKNRDGWEKLFAPMRKVDTRTTILLTTRMQSVSDMAVNVMGVERDQYLTLEGLEQDENIKLFNHHVFSGPHPHDYVHLTSIGDQIARKLGGCPLVTKVVGGHLQSNMTAGYWRKFLDKNLEHFKGTAEDIMKVLRLSYYHLPTELQICFRYCSLFAEDHEFGRKELVQMWMGSGLISHATSDSITPEDIGEQFLAQLTRKSFFDVKSRMYSYGHKEEYFVMHDLMHELARNVSFGECARITNPDMFENMKDTVRHLYVSCIHGFSVEEVKKVANLKNLRTIIIDGNELDLDKDFVCTLANFVESSKSLRLFRSKLINTSHFAVKFGELKHLRYIYMNGYISPELICGVAKLYHLILLLCRVYHLQRDAKHVRYLGCLESLRYVNYGVDGLGEFPISSLTSLQELNNYRVHGSIGNKISAIKNLRGLRELELSGLENVENHEEVINAKLNEKTNLVSLSLIWSRDSQNRIDDLVLDYLEPHGNIRELSISGSKGLKLPFWIENLSVKNLVSLSLRDCINWEHLPSLGELVLLKNLSLLDLRKLEQIGHSLDMSSRSSMELLLPPNLHTLEVKGCQELRELPILPPGLVRLHIKGTRLTTLPMMGKTSSESTSPQLVRISVTDCPFLTSLEGSLFEQKLYMGALRELQIRNCIHLEPASLPFEEMNRLERLRITRCPELRTMRDAKSMLLPSSLTILTMGQCGDLELPLLGTLENCSLTILKLENCSRLVSLPSAEVFNTSLKSLRVLNLLGCENLSSLGGLGSLPSLEWLEISKCSKLVVAGLSLAADVSGAEEEHLVNPGSSLQIDWLSIDSPSLLLVEPLKSLCHTQHLRITDGAEMKSLPEGWLLQNHASLLYLSIDKAKSLESLPPSMPGLSSLQKLTIPGAKQLQSLPDLPSSLQYLSISDAGQLQSLPDLPSSLQYLEIQGCHPDLEKKIRELASPKRNKNCHIHHVSIGNSRFIMGKECSKETFQRLRGSEVSTLISWADKQKEEKRLTWWKKPNCLKIAS